MNILILNLILYTADNNKIPKVNSIKDTMIYNMCLGFKILGHNVVLIAAEDFKPIQKESFDFPIYFVKTNLKRIFPPSVLPFSYELKQFLTKNKQDFDLIISSEVFSFSSLFASIICPFKTIIWHELALHPNRFHKIPSKFWYNVVANLFMKKVLCIVPRSIESYNFLKNYFTKSISEQVIEHGINTDKFTYSENKKNQFIFVGQFIKRKNIFSILDKFTRFLEKYENIYKLILVGRGELESEIHEYIIKNNLSHNVTIKGFVNHDELNVLLMESKALLIDTLQDNNMVSIPESIVSGTPILTNEIPTNSYIIKQNELGIVKSGWNENDMHLLCKYNKKFVTNCIKYRDKLSNIHSAEMFIEIFKTYYSK